MLDIVTDVTKKSYNYQNIILHLLRSIHTADATILWRKLPRIFWIVSAIYNGASNYKREFTRVGFIFENSLNLLLILMLGEHTGWAPRSFVDPHKNYDKEKEEKATEQRIKLFADSGMANRVVMVSIRNSTLR